MPPNSNKRSLQTLTSSSSGARRRRYGRPSLREYGVYQPHRLGGAFAEYDGRSIRYARHYYCHPTPKPSSTCAMYGHRFVCLGRMHSTTMDFLYRCTCGREEIIVDAKMGRIADKVLARMYPKRNRIIDIVTL